MRVAIVALGVTLGLLPRAEAGGEPATLRLVWSDHRGVATTLRPAIFQEAERRLRAAGLGVSWTVWDGSDRAASADEIEISINAAPPAPLPPNTMGVVYPAAGHLHCVFIFVSAIKTVLGLDPQSPMPPSPGAERDLSLAVARVILHELVHEGAPEIGHRRTGLMAPRLDRRLLVSPLLPLDHDILAALRAAAIRTDRPGGWSQAASR